MSFLYAPGPWPAAEVPRTSATWRFGRVLGRPQPDAGGALRMRWLLKRNCSLSPRQMVWVYGALCVVSIGIGLGFLAFGVPTILPFAGIELTLVGVAFWAYARHAADREDITLENGELHVEHHFGSRIEHASFSAKWVRVEPAHGDASLVELTGEGQRMRVGRYLRPEMRVPLARELRLALRGVHDRTDLKELQSER